MGLYPPFSPFLFQINLFGLPIAVRWYGAIIMSGAMFAAWLASRRAVARGIDPDHIWNQLILGLIMGIGGARIYYVAFEWHRFAGDPISALNLTTGGLAVHGSLIGAILSAVIFNAVIIVLLIPLALRGVAYKPAGAARVLRDNLVIYGGGGLLVPFVGIKLIDMALVALRLA